MDELTYEIGSLASVYHKPAEAFIGRGRVGVDELSRKEAREGLPEGLVSASAAAAATANAIQVVAQGQRSENLLDFGIDDEDEGASSSINSTPTMSNNNNTASNGLFGLDFGDTSGNTTTGLGGASSRTTVTGQPSNTLDDLLGVFDQAGSGPGSNGGIIGGMSNINMSSSNNGGSQTTDLFGGDSGNSGVMSPTSSMKSPPPSHQQQKMNDDLMGDLF